MRRNDLWFAVGLTAAALALRVYRIGAQSLWVDDLLTLHMSAIEPGASIWQSLKYNIHGPLHAFIVYAVRFVGDSDAWVRMPSAIAGAASVFYFYRWVSLWLNNRLARLAAALLVINPLHVYYSQEVRNYSVLFFFACFTSFHFHRMLLGPKRRDMWAFVLGTSAGALSNFTAAFLYAIHAVLYFLRWRLDRRRLMQWVVMALVIAVLISPWIYRIYVYIDVSKLVTPVMPGEITVEERLRGESTVTPEAVPFALYSFGVGFSFGPSLRYLHLNSTLTGVFRDYWGAVLWVAALFGFLAVRGVLWLKRSGEPWGQVLLYLAVPFTLVFLLSWQNAKAFNVRYVLLSLPAFLCLVSAGVLSLRPVAGRIAAVAVAATMLVSLANYYHNGKYAREDVRRAVREIEQRAQPSDCILAPTVKEVVRYYYRGEQSVRSIFAPPGTPKSRIDTHLAEIFANCDGVWYVRAREWADDPDRYILRSLQREYTQAELIEYDGVALFFFAR